MKRKVFRWAVRHSPIILQVVLGYAYGMTELMGWAYTKKLTGDFLREGRKNAKNNRRNAGRRR